MPHYQDKVNKMKQEICRICLKTKKRHLNEMKGGARPWIAHNFEPKPQEGKCCKECRARHSQTPVAFSPCPCHATSSPEVKKEAGNNMKPSEKIIDLVSQARKKYP